MNEKWVLQLERDTGYARYVDTTPEGVSVIGHELRLDVGMTQEEAKAVYEIRVRNVWNELIKARPGLLQAPITVQAALFNLAYTLTAKELIRRKRIWTLIKDRQFHNIPNDLLKMPIAQTRLDRVQRLANEIRTAVVKIRTNWPILREELRAKRIKLDTLPWPIRVSLGRLMELHVQTVLEYRFWQHVRLKQWPTACVEISKVPFFQHDSTMPYWLVAQLEQPEDESYLAWLDSPPPKSLYRGNPIY